MRHHSIAMSSAVCRIAGISAALLGSVAACSSSSVPPPTGGHACSFSLLAGPSLVYPAPGATAVATGVGEIIIGMPATGAYTIVPPNSAPVALGSPGPVPSPAPTALPSTSPSETYAAIALPALAASTKYRLVFEDPKTADGCPGPVDSGTYGTFTTR